MCIRDRGRICRGWDCLLEKPLTSLKRSSPTAATYDIFVKSSCFVSCLPKTFKTLLIITGCCGSHPSILTTGLDSSWYVALVILFVLDYVSKWRRNGQKGGFWRTFGYGLNVMNTRTELKNNTPNALSSPHADEIGFVFSGKHFVRYSSFNRKRLILTDLTAVSYTHLTLPTNREV